MGVEGDSLKVLSEVPLSFETLIALSAELINKIAQEIKLLFDILSTKTLIILSSSRVAKLNMLLTYDLNFSFLHYFSQ